MTILKCYFFQFVNWSASIDLWSLVNVRFCIMSLSTFSVYPWQALRYVYKCCRVLQRIFVVRCGIKFFLKICISKWGLHLQIYNNHFHYLAIRITVILMFFRTISISFTSICSQRCLIWIKHHSISKPIHELAWPKKTCSAMRNQWNVPNPLFPSHFLWNLNQWNIKYQPQTCISNMYNRN